MTRSVPPVLPGSPPARKPPILSGIGGALRSGIAVGAGRIRDWWGEYPGTQLLAVGAVLAVAVWLGTTLSGNLARLGLTPGFEFLSRSAGFEIGESWIPYSAADSYGRALAVGFLNTVQVALLSCALATVLGLTLGVARLSSNPLLSRTVQVYIEVIRNTPLLLQLFFWSLTVHALPSPRQALAPLPGVFLTNRGLFTPGITATVAPLSGGVLLLIGLGTAGGLWWLLRRRGRPFRLGVSLGAGGGLTALLWAAAGPAWGLDLPRLSGFNITGGRTLSPEFVALWIGLAVNTSASVAELVRAGIQSVPRGQWEAARALGLPERRVMRLVVLPQALRVIIPALTSSYVSLTKHSSIAVAIGYPDLVNVLNTTANQGGHVLEAISIMICVYLTLSLITSALMNLYNHRVALRGETHR
ncbi:amino acid ABC transporter permease [Novispirillum itersonii]|uniref:amino acid ABC transporter permease n=1 Tax=Novispirillum itersonii TaxID=189 RepID=UPI00036F8EE0|nr:ABC transporter permease subunit [Novispirillum itersonii]